MTDLKKMEVEDKQPNTQPIGSTGDETGSDLSDFEDSNASNVDVKEEASSPPTLKSEDEDESSLSFENEMKIEEDSNLTIDENSTQDGFDQSWKEDKSIPKGWQLRMKITKSGQRIEHIRNATGTFFQSRRAAVSWLRRQENYRPEDVELLQSTLRLMWKEGDDSLPSGWQWRDMDLQPKNGAAKVRTQWYRAPSGRIFRGRKAILKEMKSNPAAFSEEEIHKFKSIPDKAKKFSTEYDWRSDDVNLPPGWQYASAQMNSFGKIVDCVRYLSPDGRFCTSRVDAIKYMVEDPTTTPEQLEGMRRGLMADGWSGHQLLPEGWLMKPNSSRGKRREAHLNYLSDDYMFYRSTKAAISFLEASSNYTEEEVANMTKLADDLCKELKPTKYDWQENETVPDGWKYRKVECSNGLEREFFLAPDGTSYSGRKQAVEGLKKSGNYTLEDLHKMENGYKDVVWRLDPTLPPGWKMRDSIMNTHGRQLPTQWFVNEEGKVFRGRKSALEEIIGCRKYGKEDIRRFKFVIPESKKTTYEWNADDNTVPEGWLTTMISINSFGKIVKSKKFMSPDGRFCNSREDALRYMQKEGLYYDHEIQQMQEGFTMDLDQEVSPKQGWKIDSASPVKAKTRRPSKRRRSSEDTWSSCSKKIKTEPEVEIKEGSFEVENIKDEIFSDDEAEPAASTPKTSRKSRTSIKPIKIIKDEPEDGDAILRKLKEEKDDDPDYVPSRATRRSSRRSLPVKVKTEADVDIKSEGWTDGDSTVPEGWRVKEFINRAGQKVKHLQSPSGVFFPGRKAALGHMEVNKKKFSEEDIELMRSGLPVVWGDEDDTVPSGWKSRTTQVKTKNGSTTMQWFLSTEGQVHRGRKSALRHIESSGEYSPEAIKKFRSKPTNIGKKFTKEYEWTNDDDTLPEGWKSAPVEMNSFGKIVQCTRFLAPDGKYCTNRIDALRYMLQGGFNSDDDIEKMKAGLLAEGWLSDDLLPTGWLLKPRRDKVEAVATASYHYVSDTFEQFDSTKSAIKFMNSNPDKYSDEDVNRLESKVNSESKRLCPDKYDWREDDSIPADWRYRSVVCSNGLERHFFLSPDGSSFSGRKQALDHMKKTKAPAEDIRKMESGFKIQWKEDPNLPKGWKTRYTDMKTKSGSVTMQWFILPCGKIYRGRKSALRHLQASDMYTKEDIRKFRCTGDTPSKSNYDWNADDSSIPDGWKSTFINVNSFGNIVKTLRYLSPDGRFCSSRVDALRYMHKEGIFLEKDVEKMKSGLLKEGWYYDQLLPNGWLVKPDRSKDEEATYNYLTPDFQYLRSTRSAQIVMRESDLYTEDDVDRLNAMVAEGRKKIRMSKYGLGNGNMMDSVPEGWKVVTETDKVLVQAPNGSTFSSRLAAYQHMIKADYDRKEIDHMRKFLNHEGWKDNILLPKGWKLMSNESRTEYSFLSETGDQIASIEKAVKYLEANKASDEEIGKIKSLSDSDSKINQYIKQEWEEDPTVPTGWKAKALDGKITKKLFLAPDGSSFACRRSGLQYLLQKNADPDLVEEMRGKLVHEGWTREDFLPTNWLIRRIENSSGNQHDMDYWYLSAEGSLFRSTKTAVEYLTANDQYGQEDLDAILEQLDKERKQARQHRYDWVEGDDTVPRGWKIRVVEGKTRKTFFLSEDGCQFACRRSALQYMIKHEHSQESIECMREMLKHEGWADDTKHLPKGWKVRKCEGSTNGVLDVNYYYLSDTGIMFHSTRSAVAYMKKTPAKYKQDDIDRLLRRLENESKKNRPQKYDWKEDDNLPTNWKYRSVVKGGVRTDFVLTENGDQYQSRRAAIEAMIKNKHKPGAIYKVWSTLDVEGWVTDKNRLPKGWRIRSKDRLKDSWQFYFLSPQMEVFKSNKAVLDHISSKLDTYSTDDYNKVKKWIEDEQKARRGENYAWEEESDLPPGWRVRSVVTNSKNIREFFLTPDGEQVAGRKKAIEVMKSAKVSKGIINAQMKKMEQVSFINQNKNKSELDGVPDGGSTSDTSKEEEDDLIGTEMFDEDEVELMDAEDEDLYGLGPYDAVYEGEEAAADRFELSGMMPEFAPVEITELDYDEEEEVELDDSMLGEEDSDDEFNVVSEVYN